MKTEVKILKDAVHYDLQKELNQHLESGWNLHGSMMYVCGEWIQPIQRPIGRLRYRILLKKDLRQLQAAINKSCREGSFLVSKKVEYSIEDGDSAFVIIGKYYNEL